MQVTYNSILSIFVRCYPTLNKYTINSSLISIIDPSYERREDSDFANEQLTARRNIKNTLVEKAKLLPFERALSNTKVLQKHCKDVKSNDKIKYMLLKLAELDENFNVEDSPMYDNNYYYSNKYPIHLSFYELIVNFVLYACRYRKSKIKCPITEEQLLTLEIHGVSDAPYIFLENDKSYLKKYSKYYKQAVENLSQIKTILYKDESVNFYDIYICPDVSTEVNMIRDSSYLECNGKVLSTENYIKIFGKYTSIIAPGGFGKSMLLKHLFLSNTVLKKNMQASVVPIFIQVRSFNSSRFTLEEMLYFEISKYISIPREQFISDLKNGNFLLLFDGLDEIKIDDAEYFFDELNTLTERYPHNYFVTSSRPSEQAKCLNKFKLLKLHGFSTERAIQMISKLPAIKREHKEGFCSKLITGEFKKHSEIFSNPLLLTLMFIVYINKGRIPTKTYQFYQEAYGVLYREHDDVKGYKNRKYKTGMGKLKLAKVLAEFCFVSITTQHYSFSESEFLNIINKCSFANDIDPDDLLFDCTDNLSLLYLEGQVYHFVHRSFQEYFAAYHCNLFDDNTYSNLVEWFNTLKRPHSDKLITLYPTGMGVFNFVLEMNKDRMYKLILKPYLSSFIINSGNIEDDFLFFLEKTYKNIDYGYQVCNTPRDQLFRIIMEKFNLNYYAEIFGEYPEYDEYISDYLYNVDCCDGNDWWREDEVESYLEKNSNIPREKLLADLGIDLAKPDGYNYSIPVSDIINNKDFFKDFIESLMNENSQLWKNFIYTKNF